MKTLTAEKETFSSNIDNFSTVQGGFQNDNTMFTFHVADLAGQVAALKNELGQAKSEIDIQNSLLTDLEELNVASDAIIRFERLLVRILQSQAEVRRN